jgi:hypothetical protein
MDSRGIVRAVFARRPGGPVLALRGWLRGVVRHLWRISSLSRASSAPMPSARLLWSRQSQAGVLCGDMSVRQRHWNVVRNHLPANLGWRNLWRQSRLRREGGRAVSADAQLCNRTSAEVESIASRRRDHHYLVEIAHHCRKLKRKARQCDTGVTGIGPHHVKRLRFDRLPVFRLSDQGDVSSQGCREGHADRIEPVVKCS